MFKWPYSRMVAKLAELLPGHMCEAFRRSGRATRRPSPAQGSGGGITARNPSAGRRAAQGSVARHMCRVARQMCSVVRTIPDYTAARTMHGLHCDLGI